MHAEGRTDDNEGIPVLIPFVSGAEDSVIPRSSSSRLHLPPMPFLKRRMPVLRLIICITKGIPVNDMVRAKRALRGRNVRLIGPNCPWNDHRR